MGSYTHPQNAKGPTYIGAKLVYPGETVITPDPPTKKMVEAPQMPAAGDDLAKLQKAKVADVQKALPDLTEAQLLQLLELEQKSASPRATAVAAIEARLLALKTEPPPDA